MKIGKITQSSETGELELLPALLNTKITSHRHIIMIRHCIGYKGLYDVHVTTTKDPMTYIFTRGRVKPKTVLGVFKQFNIRPKL